MFQVLVLFVLSFSAFAQEYMSKEEIIKEFEALQKGEVGNRTRSKPDFMDQFKIPKLDDVIPRYLQQRLRDRVRPYRSFDGITEGRDLRHRDTPVKSQIGGRCSAYGLIASLENLLGEPEVAKLSESHLWSTYRRYSSVRAVEAAKRTMITEYEAWPHNTDYPNADWQEKSHTSLQHITFIEDDVHRAVRALEAGRPVYIGMSVTYSMRRCDPVLDPNSGNTGGGHAVGISGYVIDEKVSGGGYFILKNSWGEDCGDRGYLYMPFSYCTRGGSSYCIMWDVQGVTTGFPGVASVMPDLPSFDLNQINVRISSYKPWWSCNRTVRIELEGDSLHARQIKEVSMSVDGGEFRRPKPVDIDSVSLSFTTKKTEHDIALKIRLIDGQEYESQHHWQLK